MGQNDTPKNQNLNWLSGGGEMGQLIRSMDWTKTSLGAPEKWPQSLRTSVSLCLSSTFPILICWGPEDIQIYNDSYRPICGDIHPRSMGMPFKVCWEAALSAVGDKFDRAHLGEGTYLNNQRMFLERYGYLEEAWMTFSFGAIRDESGQVGGIFHPITETTGAMLSARRTQILRDFAAKLASAKSVEEVISIAASDKEHFELDLPFFCFYQADPKNSRAELVGSFGVSENSKLAPRFIDLNLTAESTWPLKDSAGSGAFVELNDLATRFGEFKLGPYPEAPTSALVLTVRTSNQADPFGYLVAGVSSRRALDGEYRNFFVLLANTFTTAISNVLAYEQELKRAEALAEIDRAKTTFFSNVSHEFRTPLTLILGPLEDSLQDQSDPLTANQRARQEVTHRNALRLLKLVNSLLDFSRIEAGRVQANYQPTDLAKLTTDIASNFRSATDRAGLELNINAEKLPEDIFIDPEMWEKIVLNLISNAFKFTFEGGIDVHLQWLGDKARLQISDSGIGIADEELPKLFERFHRVQGAKGRSFEGTGIGLALVQELVRMHGGAISVASKIGEGTTFTIDIPTGNLHLPQDRIGQVGSLESTVTTSAYLEEAQTWLQTPASTETLTTAVVGKTEIRPRIIIADDNSDMLSYVTSLLNQNYEIIPAVDGIDALAKTQMNPPDLLITDVMMPNLDGFGLLKAIRSNPEIRGVPVFLLSARAGEEARLEGLNAGASDYLVKPFTARELTTRVAAILSLENIRSEQTKILKASEERFRKMFAHAAVSIVLMDLQGKILQVNDAFADVLGYSPEEIIGLPFSDFTHPDDVASNLVQVGKIVRGEIPSAMFEKRYLKRSGEVLYVQTSVSAYLDDQGHPLQLVAISQDMSLRKASEEKARLAKDEADRANKSKSEFLANMSHEIRTPLGAIIGFSELLKNGSADAAERSNYTDIIARNAKALTRIIDDILDLSKVEAGKLEVDLAKMSLKEVLRDVTALFMDKVKAAGIILNLNIEDQVPDYILSDSVRLRQILINIVGNAVKFTERGSISVSVSSMGEENSKTKFKIAVKDTGRGLSPEQQAKLFKPFVQADSTTTREFGGTGLGLALSRKLAEALGGTVEISECGLGKGCTFVVSFEAKVVAAGPATEKLKPRLRTDQSLKNVRALVVDDSADNQTLIKLALKKAGATVELAENGREGLRKALEGEFDIVLMDIQMPTMDGYEVMKELTSRNYKKPVIALTAHAMEEDHRKTEAAGFRTHITKPIEFDELLTAIETALKTQH